MAQYTPGRNLKVFLRDNDTMCRTRQPRCHTASGGVSPKKTSSRQTTVSHQSYTTIWRVGVGTHRRTRFVVVADKSQLGQSSSPRPIAVIDCVEKVVNDWQMILRGKVVTGTSLQKDRNHDRS